MDKKIYDIIEKAEIGSIDSFEGLFVYFPKNEYKLDDHNKLIKNNYLCSYIVIAAKNLPNELIITYIDLPESYNGEKIDTDNDDEYNWNHLTISPTKFASLKISLDWKDFK